MEKITLKSVLPMIVLAVISVFAVFVPSEGVNFDESVVNSSDVAWILVAATLVFLMTPGLSFFYGGMVNRKSVISTMLQSFIATGLITVVWIVVGFSLAFGESLNGFVGNPTTFFFFKGVASGEPWSLAPTIPLLLFALFQMKFAVITPALVAGGVAERIRFTGYILFMILFSLLVYAPIAHWTWHPDGILFQLGVLDFAGGTVVHISAGCAALAGALILKRRKDHIIKTSIQPTNIHFALLGSGLLWFGSFGFNAGSALGANGLAASAFATTNTATAAAGLAWILFDAARGRKPSALGFCIGAVVGMVAITPAAGFVGIPQSMFIGVIASVASNMFVHWKSRSTIDDTLDVFPCHGVGGMVGMLLTGVFASTVVNADIDSGWWYGNFELFKNQFLGMLLVVGYSFTVSWLIFKGINLVYPLRVSAEEEEVGLDLSQHDEKYLEGNLLIDTQGRLQHDKQTVSGEKELIS